MPQLHRLRAGFRCARPQRVGRAIVPFRSVGIQHFRLCHWIATSVDSIEDFQPSGGSIEAAHLSKMFWMLMSAAQRLWHHVLLAILADLQSTSELARQAQEFASRWVGRDPSRDFRMVCDFANLDPDCVHRHFKRLADMEQSDRPRRPRLIQDVSSVGRHLNGSLLSTSAVR